MAVRLVITMASIAAMIALGILAFGARPSGNLVWVLLAAALGVVTFLAVGYAISALAPSLGVAQVLGNVLVYPLIMLSGATVPLAVLPESVRTIAQVSPLTQLVELLQTQWIGAGGSGTWLATGVLLVVLVTATAVAARSFRWE